MPLPGLPALEVFVAVARHRSFRKAAIERGVSTTALSHVIRGLEQNLGVRLADIAKVIRSKNSGSFELTFDVMFGSLDVYRRVQASGAVTRESLGALYGVTGSDITNFQFFEPALAFKLTIRRPEKQGSVGETDTFGAQQHAPLMEMRIP